jgi:hypothetical protein
MNDFEDWTRGFSEFLEQTARMTEQFAERTLVTFVETADQIADELEKQLRPTLDRWAEDFQNSVEPLESTLDRETERLSEELTEFLTPIVVPLSDALESWLEAIAAPLNSHIDPMVNEHPTCIGCKHYYGQSHGGHMLVCAMYPYGPEQEQCPDWESVWGQPPNNG